MVFMNHPITVFRLTMAVLRNNFPLVPLYKLSATANVSYESKMRFLFYLVMGAMVAACSVELGEEFEKKGDFSIGSLDENSALLKQLKNNGISSAFMDSDGFIGHDLRDTAEVRSVKRRFLQQGRSNPNDIHAEGVVHEAHLALYEDAFTENRIPYQIDRSAGLINIKWRAEYDETVDQIVEDVNITWLNHIVGN